MGLKDLTPSPVSLSTEGISNARAKGSSETEGNQPDHVQEITASPDFDRVSSMIRIPEPLFGCVQMPMIRRTVLNFLQCLPVAMFTKLQDFSSAFARNAASV